MIHLHGGGLFYYHLKLYVMKRITLLTGIILLCHVSMAQEITAKRGYIGVTVALAFPTGDFADDDAIRNEDASYAKTGLNYSADFGYRLGRRWGITASIRSGSNAVDESAFESSLEQAAGGSFGVSADNYRYNALMVGALVSWPADRLDVDLRFSMGYGFGTLPSIDVQYSGQPFLIIPEEDASGFAALLGGSFRYHLSDNISLMGQLNYFSMALTPQDNDLDDIEQPIDVIAIDIGVGFRLR